MRPVNIATVLILAFCSTGCITLSERSIDHDFNGLRSALLRAEPYACSWCTEWVYIPPAIRRR